MGRMRPEKKAIAVYAQSVKQSQAKISIKKMKF
jgi:hypothetical protein